ncbi:hypothetical protein [Capnocytophaga canimorsus]|uniref:hypothetical protein n=1 Tax=Capnocytophaga canimorsus TaxID=28188 RepID=UPI001EDCE10A|nr:hypothetical protein [Capnocytophaga canimorsus]GJQ04738.1 hypothetical protein CAPN009_11530 [Capnocytophaga canimorsus]
MTKQRKKIATLIVLFIGLLQSCTVNMEMTFHKDDATSILMEFDSKEMIDMMQSKSDSTSKKSNLNKFSKEWKSIYQLSEEEGKPISKDSMEVAKKIFLKGIYDQEQETGFAIKMERLDKKELEGFSDSENKEAKMLSPFVKSGTDWDGKRLIIDMKEISSKKEEKEQKKDKKEEKIDELFSGIENMLKMIDVQFNATFKFENKIKSIKGKHQNFKKIDNHTVQISVKFNEEFDKTKKNDDKIIITTE